MTATPALLAAAAGVAVGHAILPDHWVPLAVLSRTRHYRLGRVARLSVTAAVAHVAVSLLLGALIIVVGLQFRSVVEHAQNLVVGGLLVATGLVFAAMELRGRGHHHPDGAPGDDHHHPLADRGTEPHASSDHGPDPVHDPEPGRLAGLAGVIVPFGAAASPDLTILPVFLAATAAGVLASVGALAVFSLVTIATIVALTMTATFGGYQVQGAWLDRWGNVTTALVLIVVGGLVLGGII
jgi:nickel/cobalt transporter (NicO) family protein